MREDGGLRGGSSSRRTRFFFFFFGFGWSISKTVIYLDTGVRKGEIKVKSKLAEAASVSDIYGRGNNRFCEKNIMSIVLDILYYIAATYHDD